jgi:hypothetical protein
MAQARTMVRSGVAGVAGAVRGWCDGKAVLNLGLVFVETLTRA